VLATAGPGLAQFEPVGVLLTLTLAGLAGAYALARGVTVARDPLEASPFAGAVAAREHAMSRYHVRWYTITMLFLAFDMEMIFMYPWTLVISAVGTSAVVEMFVFLGVLVAGVAHAWREGALRWA
jgi:NADH-quinone oxidoreductase subunit A